MCSAIGSRYATIVPPVGRKPRSGSSAYTRVFDRVSVCDHAGLIEIEALTGGDAQLPFHEIETEDHFGYGVLDLQPRDSFPKRSARLACPTGMRNSTVPAPTYPHAFADRDGVFAEHCPLGGVDQWRGSLFDDLLVTTLEAALPLEQVQGLAGAVCEHLHLDVTGSLKEALDEQRVVSESGKRLATRRLEGALSSDASATDRIPLPPPPAEGLMSTGNPISRAASTSSASVIAGSSRPGTTGTPDSLASFRARILSPIAEMAATGGPTKARPASPHAAANWAFSERNP